MASLPLTSSSSSSSLSTFERSPEYLTIQECNVVLVDLLKDSTGTVGDALFSKGYIPSDVKESLQMITISPTEKARKLVDCILNRVKHDPSAYHEFVKILQEQGQWAELIVDKLTDCYQSAPPESSSTVSLPKNESDSKLRLEFKLPQDFPQHVIKLLKSVQVSVLLEDNNKSTKILETQLLGANGEQSTTSFTKGNIEWSSRSGKTVYGAAGRRDVLLLVPTSPTTGNPDSVQRRSRNKLTDEETKLLESQGIRDCHHDDLSIMKARYGLDKRCTIVGVESGRELTCEGVKNQIASLLSNTDKEGVVVHYIGSGKTRTGDWCFSDGFITFRELMDLYNQHFKGHVLTIISDCSYSGSWVKECMVFMDEQGVGPCGHVAKEKGIILVKVFASCLSNEIPAELAFSTHTAKNGKNNEISFITGIRRDEIRKDQLPSGIDVTEIQCKNKNIDEPCTMAPGSTWQRWSAEKRIMIATGTDRGRPAWHYLQVVDEETIRIIKLKIQGANAGTQTMDLEDFGKILKSGWGQEPPDEAQKWIKKTYFVDYDYKPIGQ